MASDEIWAKWRRIWENDPKETFTSIADALRISKQAVAKRAKREGWAKTANPVVIARKAHQKADTTSPSAPPEDMRFSATDPEPEVDVGATLALATEESAVDKRAEILARHRQELMHLRGKVYNGLKQADFEALKRAKISTEALKIIQERECKAWGLDVDTTPPDAGEIVRG